MRESARVGADRPASKAEVLNVVPMGGWLIF